MARVLGMLTRYAKNVQLDNKGQWASSSLSKYINALVQCDTVNGGY